MMPRAASAVQPVEAPRIHSSRWRRPHLRFPRHRFE
jgi:hypothetical protein